MTTDASVLTRVRARLLPGTNGVDALIVLALAVWALSEAVLVDEGASVWVRCLVALAYALPLLWRRVAPLQALCLLIGALSLYTFALTDTTQTGAMPFPALLIGLFSTAMYGQSLTARFVGLPCTWGIMVAALSHGADATSELGDFVILAFFIFAAWIAGVLMRRRAEQEQAERERGVELAKEAVSDERARVARELHDVVAHSVSIIAMQAGAAEATLDRDVEATREHLAVIRRTARESLAEMRRLVGVLREDDAVRAPQPTLAALPDLVAESSIAGVPTTLEVVGAPVDLAPALELAAYRAAQEALTNVRRHAYGAEASMVLRYEADRLELGVTNGPAPADARAKDRADGLGAGHGLVGMRERIQLYGGTVESGPRPDGGFAVLVHLPLEEIS